MSDVLQLLWDVTHRFHGGKVVCKLVKYWQVLVLYASSYVLLCTALDRYIAICHPMRSHPWTVANAHRLASAAWVVASVFAIPQLVIFDFVELAPAGSGVYDCWGHFQPEWTLPLYITWFAGAVYIVPLLCLAVIYIRICSVVWHSAESAPPLPSLPAAGGVSATTRVVAVGGKRARSTTASLPAVHANYSLNDLRYSTTQNTELAAVSGLSKAKTKTVKLTLTVVVSYVICWGPFIIAQLWSAWDPNAPFEGNRSTHGVQSDVSVSVYRHICHTHVRTINRVINMVRKQNTENTLMQIEHSVVKRIVKQPLSPEQ